MQSVAFAMDSGGNYYALNLKNKKIYYYLTDEWDENASREYNFETNTRYIAQSFNYFINHLSKKRNKAADNKRINLL